MSRKRRAGENIQRFGRALLMPITVMAPVGMLLGLTGVFSQQYIIDAFPVFGHGGVQATVAGVRTVAGTLFGNLPLLFAVGVAYGMSKKEKGVAAFSAVIGYLTLLSVMNVWLTATGNLAKTNLAECGQGLVLGIQTVRLEALGGIITGLLAASVTDKFCNLQLPDAFSFFGGKKAPSIIIIFVMAAIGLVMPFIWNLITQLLTSLSYLFMHKIAGTFSYWFANRLLIPFGLHHIWNALIRLTPAGGTYFLDGQTYVGVLPALTYILFQAPQDSAVWKVLPVLTRFDAQVQMVDTLFVLPAICLALYNSARKSNRAFVKGILITMALTAVLGGVTEPVEFSFIFIAPLLFLFHALMMGVSGVALYLLGTGVGYIRGTIFEFVIFGILNKHSAWWNIVIVGLPAAAIYYGVFRWAIERWNIPTIGREEENVEKSPLLKEKRYDEIAELLVEGLGGRENIVGVENCITRLRIDVADVRKISQAVMKKSGAFGIFLPSKNHIRIVFGTQVEFVRNALEERMKSRGENS